MATCQRGDLDPFCQTYPIPWYRIDQLDRLGEGRSQRQRVRPANQRHPLAFRLDVRS
jgi:hypothetical protein